MQGQYTEFLDLKTQLSRNRGFDPLWMPTKLYDFQKSLVEWACRRGRAALFADCGLGKTPMQLAWADNVVRKTGRPVLVLTPLAVSYQTVIEGVKFGIEATHRRDEMHPGDRIVVSNYERLSHFNADDFAGAVCDESSILKNFDGATRAAITQFMRKVEYRLLCTATASPNDYIELGCSSEAIGEMGFVDMLSRFFKKRAATFSRKDEFRRDTWSFRGHSERDFWRWVCSWARAMRKPSDLGYADDGFVLPPLDRRSHVIDARSIRDGFLFDLPAMDMREEREEVARTTHERCELAAQLANAHRGSVVCWVNRNEEGHLLERLVNGAVEVEGRDSEDRKEAVFRDFVTGSIRAIVTKPKICGFGMNWQHCAHQTMFVSHSYEQYYQAIRRSWRFGQLRPVVVDIISTRGQVGIQSNLMRKAAAAEHMFDRLVAMMRDELRIKRVNDCKAQEEIPQWLLQNKSSPNSTLSIAATA